MTKKTKEIRPNKGGRPTKMTPEVIAKLEYAFAISCTDQQACIYAEISVDTLYYYQVKNPNFAIRKEKLKQQAILKAKNTVIKSLDQVENAKWYLERKAKNEYSTKIETSGTIEQTIVNKDIEKIKKLLNK